LIKRLDEDDNLDGNERALLAYIKHKVVEIDPALDPYFKNTGSDTVSHGVLVKRVRGGN
jgi:hypothetical protein